MNSSRIDEWKASELRDGRMPSLPLQRQRIVEHLREGRRHVIPTWCDLADLTDKLLDYNHNMQGSLASSGYPPHEDSDF